MDEHPRVAALGRGRRERHEQVGRVGPGERFLPQRLLLRRGQQQRNGGPRSRVDRVVPKAAGEGAEGKNVRGFPGPEASSRLVPVEIPGERAGEAQVRRHDRDARLVTLPKCRKQLDFFQDRAVGGHPPNDSCPQAQGMSPPAFLTAVTKSLTPVRPRSPVLCEMSQGIPGCGIESARVCSSSQAGRSLP